MEQISELQTKWDKLELLMESHELMIKEQVTGYVLFALTENLRISQTADFSI